MEWNGWRTCVWGKLECWNWSFWLYAGDDTAEPLYWLLVGLASKQTQFPLMIRLPDRHNVISVISWLSCCSFPYIAKFLSLLSAEAADVSEAGCCLETETLCALWFMIFFFYLVSHFQKPFPVFRLLFLLALRHYVAQTNETTTCFTITCLTCCCSGLTMIITILSSPESRNCCCPSDHHSGKRRGYWLLQTLYVSGDLHHDQEAPEVKARGLLLLGPTGLWNLDVYCVCLHWSQCCPVFGE